MRLNLSLDASRGHGSYLTTIVSTRITLLFISHRSIISDVGKDKTKRSVLHCADALQTQMKAGGVSG